MFVTAWFSHWLSENHNHTTCMEFTLSWEKKQTIDPDVTLWANDMCRKPWHLPPNSTRHSDVPPQLVMGSVRTCKTKSRLVWATHNSDMCQWFPQQCRQGCNSLTFSLCDCHLKGNMETRQAFVRFSQDVMTESAVFSFLLSFSMDKVYGSLAL